MPVTSPKFTAKSASKIIEKLRNVLAKKGQRDEGTPVEAPNTPFPATLTGHFRQYAWNTYMIRLLVLNVAVLALAAGVIWFANHRLNSKAPVLVRAKTSLKEKAEAFFQLTEVSYDSVALFIVSTLPLLHGVDEGGAPMLPLARGLVSSAIYEEAQGAFTRDMPKIQKNQIHQHLHITRVTNVVADPKTRRIAAYVKGYLVVAIQKDSAAPVFIPYRANVVLENNPPSKLNSSPYFLFSREERINAAALSWDREMEKGVMRTSNAKGNQ